jgi:hypothetical protein
VKTFPGRGQWAIPVTTHSCATKRSAARHAILASARFVSGGQLPGLRVIREDSSTLSADQRHRFEVEGADEDGRARRAESLCRREDGTA